MSLVDDGGGVRTDGSAASLTNLPTSLGRKPPSSTADRTRPPASSGDSVSSPGPPPPPAAGYPEAESTDSSPMQPPPPPATVTVPGVRLNASQQRNLKPPPPAPVPATAQAHTPPVATQQPQPQGPPLDIPLEHYNAMSRLEKARYNALRAAQTRQQGLGQSDAASISSSTNTAKLQKLQRHTQELTQPNTTPNPNARVGSSKLSSMIRQQKTQAQSQQVNTPAGGDMAVVLKGLQAGLHGAYSATSTDAATPHNATPAVSKLDEQRVWASSNNVFRTSKELHALLAGSYGSLKEVFTDYCDHISIGGTEVAVLRLGEVEGARGVSRLLEDFGVSPTYLSRKEVRIMFALAVASQKNHRAAALTQLLASAPDASTGSGLLDWSHFLVLLVLIANYALSKTNAFNSLYPSVEVCVM